MSRTEEATDALPARVSAAYRYCEAVTLGQARNFSYGIRLLPPAKRRAMSALYAFSRRVDDIGDGELPPEVKRARLAGARALVVAVREDAVPQDGTDPVAVALHHAATRFPIPLDALDELIDGVPVEKHMGAESDRVALRLGGRLDQFSLQAGSGLAFGSQSGFQCFPGKPKMVRMPDAAFVAAGCRGTRRRRGTSRSPRTSRSRWYRRTRRTRRWR